MYVFKLILLHNFSIILYQLQVNLKCTCKLSSFWGIIWVSRAWGRLVSYWLLFWDNSWCTAIGWWEDNSYSEVVNTWGDCGDICYFATAIVCGLFNHLPWSFRAGGCFLYHIVSLEEMTYCCFSLIDGEGFVTWDFERVSSVAWWCRLPCDCMCSCDYVNTHTCVCVCVCVCVSCDVCVGGVLPLGLHSINMRSITCLHAVSSVSLGLHSVDTCMWALCVYTLLVLCHWAYTVLTCKHCVSTHC